MARMNMARSRRRLELYVTDARLRMSYNAARTARKRVRQNITAKGRVNTGRMRDAIKIEKRRVGVWRIMGGTGYTLYQEKGVKGPVYPIRAKALRFKPKGSSAFVFAKKTSGFPPGNFFKDAIAQLRPEDFRKYR